MLKPDNSEESSCFQCHQASRLGGYNTLNRVFCKAHEDHDRHGSNSLKRRQMCDSQEENDDSSDEDDENIDLS